MLRVAESLNRSRVQVVSALELPDHGAGLLLQIRTSGNIKIEILAAHRYLEASENLLRKVVRITATAG